MAIITDAGITGHSLEERKEFLENLILEAFPNASISPETPIGQIISIASLAEAELDENVVNRGNALSATHVTGKDQDDLYSLLGFRRSEATHSRVDVYIEGPTGTIITTALIATVGPSGAQFVPIRDYVITSPDSPLIITMRSVETGPVAAPAGTLVIAEPTAYTDITRFENIQDAVLGSDEESNANFRRRYQLTLARNALGTVDAIRAAMYLAGASLARVDENNSDEGILNKRFYLPAHSIVAIAQGGQDNALADAIKRNILGPATNGGKAERLVLTGGSHGNSATIIATTDGSAMIGGRDYSPGYQRRKLGSISYRPAKRPHATNGDEWNQQE